MLSLARSLHLHGIRGDGTLQFLNRLSEGFDSTTYSVGCLPRSKQEAQHKDNEGSKLEDRNWN